MTKKDYKLLAGVCVEIRKRFELLPVTTQKDPEYMNALFQNVVLIPLTNALKQDSPRFDDDTFWEMIYGK